MVMNDLKIQQVWNYSYADFSEHHMQSNEQLKTSHAIQNCKPACWVQRSASVPIAVTSNTITIPAATGTVRTVRLSKKELWMDKRRAEVIDSPYFHVVFTLPHELNPLLYHNQKPLYGLLHRCSAETLLELSADKKYLGAPPELFRFSTPGTRHLIIMYICTVSYPAALHRMGKSVNQKVSFLSRCLCYGINLREIPIPFECPVTVRCSESTPFFLQAGNILLLEYL